jgi:RNA polymerase sigma-70 factor (ECF subfamily)
MPRDEELMAAVRGGDRGAFEQLFDRYREPVWRFFRRRIADPERAADLAQEAFLVVWQNAPRFEPRAAFRSYLFGIAFNLLAAARRRWTSLPSPLAGLDREPEAGQADPADVMWVRRALAKLDDGDREIVMLREYDGLSYEEIAALLEVPAGTVRSRLFRARQALREELERQPAAVMALRGRAR